MESVKKHLKLRGSKVKDNVTGVEGIVDFVSFDLYGCIQARINPGLDKDKNQRGCDWLDVSRLTIINKRAVLPVDTSDIEVVEENLRMLGFKCEHKVTGLKGVIDCISFDLWGTTHCGVDPGMDKDKKQIDGVSFVILSLTKLGKKPVMNVPDFEFGIQAEGKQGPANKRGRFL